MRRTLFFIALVFGVAAAVWAQQVSTKPNSNDELKAKGELNYSVKQRGPHHKVWERVEYESSVTGHKVPRRRSYYELATGLHFKNDKGEWEESKAEIEILPNNAGAIAAKGQHKVIFPQEIQAGLIELQMPDQNWLQSRVWGLAYFDASTGESVLLAEVKESEGLILGDNVVVYPDFCTDLLADLRLTYSRAGFEQDVVLRESPPAPEEFGLNRKTTRLQVLTEFIEAPQPTQIEQQAGELADKTLGFGAMQIGAGNAFSVGADGDRTGDAPVAKQWERLDGRDFLIEEVLYERVAEELQKLPAAGKYEGASLQRRGHGENVIAGLKQVMSKRYVKAAPKPGIKRMAKAALKPASGFVMDYVSLISSVTNYTFETDTTYYLSGSLYSYGTNTFEAGAVIKYATNAALIINPGPMGDPKVHWGADASRPVMFTAKDDDSVGETISDSTGNPTGPHYASTALSIANPGVATTLAHFHIAYAKQALSLTANGSYQLWHGEIIHCGFGITGGGVTPSLHNVLFASVRTNFNLPSGTGIAAKNVTFAGSDYLITRSGPGNDVTFTNCVIANVTNLSSGTGTVTGGYNGFYNTIGFGATQVTNTTWPFQSFGNGDHYLPTNSVWIDAGSTTANTVGLYHYTTQTNQVKETSSTVDLGYHYVALDSSGNPIDTDGDGLPDALEDSDGDGMVDGGETSWGLAILTQPQTQSVGACGSATLSVTAAGIAPLSYQWKFAGTNIAGATNSTLLLDPVSGDHAGTYSVVVTNILGAVTSSNAVLTVGSECIAIASGLVGWWRGEGNASDTINTNHGSIGGGVIYTNGMVGQAFKFDGFSGKISIPDAPALRPTNFTLEAWVYPTALTDWATVVLKEKDNSNLCYGLYARDSGNYPGGRVNAAGSEVAATSSTALAVNTWTHLATTYDGSTLRLYVDGVLVGSQTISGAVVTSGQPLWIGGNYQWGEYFTGFIDEVSLYDRALSSNEVAAIYCVGGAGKCIPPPTIVTHPENRTALVGETVTLSVVASGIPPLTYQWYFNATNLLAGATNTSLILTNAQTTNSGGYSVVVANVGGSVTSSTATVIIHECSGTLLSGLVGWWRGEDNANDTIGGNHGSLFHGTVAYASGMVGRAFQFDGDTKIGIPNASVFGPTNFTLEAWVYPTALPSSPTYWRTVILKAYDNNNLSYGLYAQDEGAYPAGRVNAGGSETPAADSTQLSLNTWTHLATTYDGAFIKLYVNGAQVASQTKSGAITLNSSPLWIGGNEEWEEYFTGLIDEAALYNRALSSNEVAAIYSAGTLGRCPLETNEPPVISWITPTNNQLFASAPTNILLWATNNGGPITAMLFYSGTNYLGQTNAAPYQMLWTNVAAGTYTLSAVGTNSATGDWAIAHITNVVVASIPQVQITYPTDVSVFLAGDSLTVTGLVVNAAGVITNVEFYINYVKVGDDAISPYTYAWNSIAAGAYPLHARAYSDLGTVGQSPSISVFVDGPPTVTILTPQNEARPGAIANIRLTAIAEDDGTVTNVTYYLRGTNAIGSATQSPYTLLYTNLVGGQYWFHAVATDNLNQSSVSQTVTNDVIRQAPEVNIIIPQSGDVFAAGEPILIQALATDADGTVTNVVFRLEDTPIATNNIHTANIFSFLWTNAPIFTTSNLFAVATDDDGLSRTSTPVSISVEGCAFYGISNFVLSVSNIIGGNQLTGTVILSNAATTGGQAVNVYSSSENVIVPTYVFVPENEWSNSFAIMTLSVIVTNSVTITALYHAQNPIVQSLAVLPESSGSLSGDTNQSSGIVVTNLETLTAADLVQEIVGPGIQFSNATFTGTNRAAGVFRGGNGVFEVTSGIILSSGDITNVIGPNDISDATGGHPLYGWLDLPGDSDLADLTGVTNNDAAILEFDFIPETEIVTWEYVFASEEYNEWTVFCDTPYNDVFGFFVTNAISSATNVALLPDGTPVTINNVNSYTNSDWFADNTKAVDDPDEPNCFAGGANLGYSSKRFTQMDGLTKKLTVTARVIPGIVNRIKLAIADTGDRRYDSVVIIKSGSFRSAGATVVTRDDQKRQYSPFAVTGPQAGAFAASPATFDTRALWGSVTGARVQRSGILHSTSGSRFDVEVGVSSLTNAASSFGLLFTNANAVATTDYSKEWTLPETFHADAEAHLDGVYSLRLSNRVSSICGQSYVATDWPQTNWPAEKNILTLAIVTDRIIPQGRCRDFVLTSGNAPVNGTWDIVFRDQVIASSGKPNGWDVEEDYTFFAGFIVTVPTNAVSDAGYEVRVRQPAWESGGSASFTVLPARAIPTAPVLLPLIVSTNAVSSSGTIVSLTVAIDAPASLGGAHVALTTNGIHFTTIVIPDGTKSVTTNITVLGSGGTDFEIFGSFNGYRKARVRVTGGNCDNPSDPAGLTITTNQSANVVLTWNPVNNATSYNVYRSVYAATNYLQIFSRLAATNYTDTEDLLRTVSYYYRITAITNWCESSPTETNIALPYPIAAPAPWIIPHGGIFNDTVNVLLTNYVPGLRIYYTTNGQPDTSSDYFTDWGVVTITNSSTIRAFTFDPNVSRNYAQDSRIVFANFTIVTPTSIGCGVTNQGALTLTNAFSTVASAGYFASRFKFTADAADVGKVISIIARSSNFDTYLYLKDNSTNILAGNDDYWPDSTDSQILYRVRNEGAHLIELTSYSPWEMGDFSLEFLCLTNAALRVFTNDVSAFTTNAAPIPNYGVINFGTNASGVSVTNYILITNSGNGSLVISNIGAFPNGETNDWNGFFVAPTSTVTLAPNEVTNLAVWMTATNASIFSGYLVFESNDGGINGGAPQNPFFIGLTGQVDPVPPPSFVEFFYPPVGGLNMPATNATITNVTVPIGVIAFDLDGIDRVSIFTNETPTGTPFVTLTTTPYLYTWTNPPAGEYTFSTRAYDLADPENFVDSQTNVFLTVGAPTLTLVSANTCVGLSNTLYAIEAHVTNGVGQAVSGATVTFVVSGAHNFTNSSLVTDLIGRATLTYTGTNAGSDWIFASATVDDIPAYAEPYVRSWAYPAGCNSNFLATLSEADDYGKGCDCPEPVSFADFYSITGAANDVVTFTMKSTNFSTYLFLLDTNCNRVAWTNEMLSLRDSQLRVTLPSNGTYIVEATSTDLFKTGDYTLQMTCVLPTEPDIAVRVHETNFPSYTVFDLGITNVNSSVTNLITITNTGGATLNITGLGYYYGQSNLFTLTPSPVMSLAAGAGASFTLEFFATNSGRFVEALILTNDDPDEYPFVINLTAIANPSGTAPSVAITAPANNSTNIAPANIEVAAEATPNGEGVSITNVTFIFRSQGATYLIGHDITELYSALWQNVPAGTYELLAVAQDHEGRTTVSAPVNVTVKTTTQNHPPVAVTDRPIVLANSVNNPLNVLTNDTDADGDSLTVIDYKLSSLPGPHGDVAIIDGGKRISYTPMSGYGSPDPNLIQDGFSYLISDGKGGTNWGSVLVAIYAAEMPSVTFINPPDDNLTTNAGAIVPLEAEITNTTNVVKVEFYLGENKIGEITNGVNGVFTFNWTATFENCNCAFTATAIDKFGQQNTSGLRYITVEAPEGNLPVARFDNLLPDVQNIGGFIQTNLATIRDGLFSLYGRAYDDDSSDDAWQLHLLDADGEFMRDLTPSPNPATGYQSGPVGSATTSNLLATCDFTTVRNGIYGLRLRSMGGYAVTESSVRFRLESELKIGQFTFTEQDMVIPVNGIPLTVMRTYDSMNLNKGDFGYSWTYTINDLEIELYEDRAKKYDVTTSEPFSLRVGGYRDVTLTLPGGRRATFMFYWEAVDCTGSGFDLCLGPAWQSPPGITNITLRAMGEHIFNPLGANEDYAGRWKADSYMNPDWYEFPGYILTLADGTEMHIVKDSVGDFDYDSGINGEWSASPYGPPYLSKIVQRNGDTLYFKRDEIGVFGQPNLRIQHINASNEITRSILIERDGQGRIRSISDPMGQNIDGLPVGNPSLKYEYNNAGNLAKVLKLVDRTAGTYLTNQYYYENSQFKHYITGIRDSRGKLVARNEYDTLGRLLAIQDAGGNTSRFEHDLANRREIQYDRSNQPTQFKYDSRGNVLLVTDPLGHTNSFAYDDNGYRLYSADALGRTTYYTNDANGNVLSVVLPHPPGADPADYATHFAYDQYGNQTRVQMPTGAVINNIYDANGNLRFVTDGEDNLISSTEYDGNGLPKTETDRFGSLNYVYDALGNLTHMTNSLGQVTESGYDPNGNLTNLVDNGQTNAIFYDALNRETGADYGNDITVNYGFEGEGEWITVSGPTLGNMERQVDDQGRLAGWETANGSSPGFAYDVNGRLQYETNSVGVVTYTAYDLAGRVVATTNLTTGAGIAFGYDPAGQRTAVTNALGHYTSYTYNVDGSLAAMTDPMMRQWMYDYDTGGACCGGGSTTTTVTDPLGRQTIDLRSAYGLPISTIWRSGSLVSSNYIEYLADMTTEEQEAEEYPVAITDEGNRTRRYDYDDLGRLYRATDLSGATWWTNQFDAETGALTNVISPTGETNAYTYDDLDNVKSIQFGDGNSVTNFYNEENRLSGVRLPSGVFLTNFYDFAGRLTNRSSTIGETASFEYNGNDAVTKMTDNTGGTTNLYDAAGRMWGIDYPSGASVRYQLDVLDRIAAITNKASVDGTAYVTWYWYDPLGNVTNVIDPFNGSTKFEYDRVGRRVRRLLPNNVVTEWQYDLRDRVTNLTHKTSGGIILTSFTYVRNAGGEPSKIIREGGDKYVVLQYDPALRLTNEVYYTNAANGVGGTIEEQIGYGYDAAGSRVRLHNGEVILTNSVSGAYRITAVNDAGDGSTLENYSYDNGGRVTAIARDGTTLNLGYNTADQVTAVTNGASWVTYGHDATGRRTASTNNSTVRKFLVAATPGTDLESPLLIANASGAVQQGYVYLGDDPILRFDDAGNAVYYLEDAMGSIAALTDAAGTTKIASFNYDGFGNVRSQTGSTTAPTGTGGDFRFHGAWLESDSGLYNMRAREYDARMGRFTSSDPIKGDIELPEGYHSFIYGNNNPFVFIDRSGKSPATEQTSVSAIQTVLNSMRIGAGLEGRRLARNKVTDMISSFARSSLASFLPGNLSSLMKGLSFENKVRQILCEYAGEVGGYFYFGTPVKTSGEPIRSGLTCVDVNSDGSTDMSKERKGVRNREVGAWIDLVIGGQPPRDGGSPNQGKINNTWVALEIKLSTKTVANYFKNSKKMNQLTSTLNYATKHTYAKTTVIFVAMYDRRINRKVFPMYEKKIMMMAVRRSGVAYVDIITDIKKKSKRK